MHRNRIGTLAKHRARSLTKTYGCVPRSGRSRPRRLEPALRRSGRLRSSLRVACASCKPLINRKPSKHSRALLSSSLLASDHICDIDRMFKACLHACVRERCQWTSFGEPSSGFSIRSVDRKRTHASSARCRLTCADRRINMFWRSLLEDPCM